MKIVLGLIAISAFAQTKQIDIGAQDAPLSDQERTELAAAVAKHNYVAEKAVIDKAIAEHPLSREMHIMAGRLAYLEKQPKEAADAFERADKIKPLGEDDRMTLAQAYQFSGRPTLARAEMVRLTKAFPANAQYFYLLGRFDVLDNHMEDAAVSLRKAVMLNPDLLRAWEQLGQVQEGLGLADEARKTYQLAADRNRARNLRWEWSPLDLGVLLLKDGELEKAQKLFLEALEYNPRFGWAHYYLGQMAQKKGNDADSMNEYRAAVVDIPTLRQAWLALGRGYTRLGQTAEADRCLAIFKDLEAKETARAHK